MTENEDICRNRCMVGIVVHPPHNIVFVWNLYISRYHDDFWKTLGLNICDYILSESCSYADVKEKVQ